MTRSNNDTPVVFADGFPGWNGETPNTPRPGWAIEEYLEQLVHTAAVLALPPVTEADNEKVMAVVDGEWEPSLIPIDDEKIEQSVNAWLDDHPEATTTVQDGSITNAKLASSFVTPGTAAAYSSSATYAVGDYVFYGGTLYRCITAITTAEAWTAAHWTAAALGDDVGDLKSAISVLEPTATAEDVGKALIAKTVTNGKVSEYELAKPDSGLSEEAKQALLACFRKVSWIDEHGQDYYDALEAALNDAILISISALFNQGSATIYADDSLETLKQYLTVTAAYSNGTTATVVNYVLSGTLTEGTSVITVSYEGKTATFNAIVEEAQSKYIYSYADGDMVKIEAGSTTVYVGGTPSVDDPFVIDVRPTKSPYRRAFYLSDGASSTSPMYKNKNDVMDGLYTPLCYPIPVPSDATTFTVSITPASQYLEISLLKPDESSASKYIRPTKTNWTKGICTGSVNPQDTPYIAIVSKYDSAGSSYPTEPTELRIEFGRQE